MISRTLGTSSRKFARLRANHPTVGLFAQALYPLIVASSDDYGRLQGDAFTVKHSVWSTTPEVEATFEAALVALAAEGLIVRYAVGSDLFLQVVDFESHQTGLHKRTASRFPEPSGKFPEIPGDSLLIEQNRREENRREEEQKSSALTRRPPRPTTRGRLTLHPWQIDELLKALGPHADAFDLDAWIWGLSAKADAEGLVVDRKALWPWVQSELVAECRRRGLPVATEASAPTLSKRTAGLMAVISNVSKLDKTRG